MSSVNKFKYIMKKFLLLVFFMPCSGLIFSQGVHLMDLTILPLFNTENVSTDTIDYLFNYKIDMPENASQMVLKLGSIEESSDVMEIVADIIHENGENYISYNNHLYLIYGIQAKLLLSLSKTQIEDTSVFTLYIIDNSGTESNHYYLNN